MKKVDSEGDVALESLDLGHLGLFVGLRVNEMVTERLHAAGFVGLRSSHGFAMQHLLRGPVRIGALAERLAVTQQAASKTIAELERLGYVEQTPTDDARVRLVQLSPRGHAAVEKTRALRREVEDMLKDAQGARAVEAARRLLARSLVALGGAPEVRARRVRPPR